MEEHPLTYKRQTLIESLQERLAAREKQREDEKKKAADRNKKVRDQIVELMDKYQQFLVWISDRALRVDLRPGTEAYKEEIDRCYGLPSDRDPAVSPYDPDEMIKRLIRIYEKAEDDEVKVDPGDDVYNYL